MKKVSKTTCESSKNIDILNDPLNYISISSQRPSKVIAESRKTNFNEIYIKPSDEHIKKQSSRCLDCGNPYCEWKCPLHNIIPNWLELSKNGQFEKAAELMHETNPLPEICGRVCPQDRLCEEACTLETGFGAVTIGDVEKQISDKALANNWRPDLSNVKKLNKKVAVIGAGPAGIGCAELLARNGVDVTVYDRYPEIGGLLTFGIPGFKLEKEVIRKRRKFLEDIGITFKLNVEVGNDIKIEDIQKAFDSVFLGLGCYTSLDGELKGKKSKGVINALDYLIGNVNQQEKFNIKTIQSTDQYSYKNLKGKNVLVLGGGDTAMDCVRSAVRQNASKVTCVYRRDKHSMPGSPREVENAIEEGVEFIFNHQPTEILSNNNIVNGVNFDLASDDTSKKNNSNIIDADVVIIAFGFAASPSSWFSDIGLRTKANGLLDMSKGPLTNIENLFAGGDMVSGADLVVTAIAQGRDAATEILNSFG
ncbi:MAG: glutamate synthase (NADPH/NADH) small chain [Polaribacter sp.]|jgi:glutamate synthase (NADPH/NADH) small chain